MLQTTQHMLLIKQYCSACNVYADSLNGAANNWTGVADNQHVLLIDKYCGASMLIVVTAVKASTYMSYSCAADADHSANIADKARYSNKNGLVVQCNYPLQVHQDVPKLFTLLQILSYQLELQWLLVNESAFVGPFWPCCAVMIGSPLPKWSWWLHANKTAEVALPAMAAGPLPQEALEIA